jgi:16S rRNA (guanine527-N7)-methyltransferase
MDDARIAELLAPFLGDSPGERGPKHAALSLAELRSISMYIDLLLRWNARINLTAVRQPEEIVTRHFGESFFLARHLLPGRPRSGRPGTGHVGTAALGCPAERSSAQPGCVGTGVPTCPAERSSAEEAHQGSSLSESLIDVGSGAGFPGLPIKIWAPHIRLTLIESNQKKVAFLREVVRALTLTNVDVFAGRAAGFPARASIVTLRAVERFDTILPTAVRLLDDSGWLALLVGESQLDRVRTLVPELTWSDPIMLPLSATRIMIIGTKESR